MTFIPGFDCTNPPTPDQAGLLATLGFRFANVYIGGPRAAYGPHETLGQLGRHGWPNDAIAGIASVSVGSNGIRLFLPTYVGRQSQFDPIGLFTYAQGQLEGADADVLTGACGFDSSTILCLDVEYGTWQQYGQAALDYMDGWCNAVHDAGHPTMIYSDLSTLSVAGSHFDLQWVSFPGGRYPYTSAPQWNVAQVAYATLSGVVLDVDIADSNLAFATYTPPPPPPVIP